MNKPVLGIDLGRKKTGLALSENGIFARPLRVIHHPDSTQAIASLLAEAVAEYTIHTLVVGLPYHHDGSLSEQAKWVQATIQAILPLLPDDLELVYQNERASSRDGKYLYPDLPDDLSAAILILQDYLDQPD